MITTTKGGESMSEKQPAKAAWQNPKLTVHGTVEELTQQTKGKRLGFVDDFGVSGVSDA